MKRIILCLTLAASMLLCAACADKTQTPAGETNTPAPQEQTQPETPASEPTPDETPKDEPPAAGQTDWTPQYASVLDVLCDAVYNGWNDENEYPMLPTGVIELATWDTGVEAAQEVGYCFTDLNGDGTAELLVFVDGDTLVGGYSLSDGKPVQFLDGWYRNIYYLLKEGRIYNQGSGGAAYAIFGTYRLSDDGTELVCEDYYFTDVEEGTVDQLVFYHNTTGEWDTEKSERFDGTEDEFWAKSDEMMNDMLTELELTLLSDYEYTGILNQPLDCKVRLDYEDDVAWWLSEVEEIGTYVPALQSTGDADEVSVVFRAAGSVEQFKLLSLSLKDVDASGNPVFEVSELCALPDLKALSPLSVPMKFPGDMPTSGFSYVEDGTERCFSVSQSGRDGALVVAEFNAN